MLVQKVFPTPKALFFPSAINYVANRLRREQQDCSTLPSSSITVSGMMDMDEGGVMAVLSSSISKKWKERWKMQWRWNVEFILLPPFFSSRASYVQIFSKKKNARAK
mmetsp:Transcript_5716/g.8396  ORF Transcript_5716/g.8396 Transcript_5716/m.8396 type:complete len:107 (-) Transcript_5716:4061-4381(-)